MNKIHVDMNLKNEGHLWIREVTTGGLWVMVGGCSVSGTLRSSTVEIQSVPVLGKILR